MTSKESLAVVIPIYNEEYCIDELVKRLLALKNNFTLVDFTFCFVNDGSKDRSLEILLTYAHQYSFIQVINFSRNFGHQLAVTAGLDFVDADVIVIIDADLQDPPELIKDLYDKMKEGYDVVYAKRNLRKGDSFFKRITAQWFYSFINMLCKFDIPKDTGDFRLITRQVSESLKQMRERHRFIRGMVPWTGFRSAPYYFNRDERFAGETKYPLFKMINFALDAIFSFSHSPLRLATYTGFISVLLGGIGAFIILLLRIFTTYNVPGVTGVILTIIFMCGVQIFMIGIIGEYIGRIFDEVKKRPLYIVQQAVNFPEHRNKNIDNFLSSELYEEKQS